MTLNAKNRSEKGFKMHKSLQIRGWFLPKKIDLPTQGGGVEVGILGGQKIKSPGNVMNCPENQYICFYPSHPGGGSRGGGGGLKFKKSGKFHELSRKSIKKNYPPPPPKGVEVGILGGQKIKSPGNVMNCPENQYNLFLPIPPGGGGVPGGGVGGVKISKVRSIS